MNQYREERDKLKAALFAARQAALTEGLEVERLRNEVKGLENLRYLVDRDTRQKDALKAENERLREEKEGALSDVHRLNDEVERLRAELALRERRMKASEDDFVQQLERLREENETVREAPSTCERGGR